MSVSMPMSISMLVLLKNVRVPACDPPGSVSGIPLGVATWEAASRNLNGSHGHDSVYTQIFQKPLTKECSSKS